MNHLFLLMKNSVNGGRYWMTKSSFSLGVRPFKLDSQFVSVVFKMVCSYNVYNG